MNEEKIKYFQTYIRINTPSYYNNNVAEFVNNEQREQWQNEVKNLVEKLNYKLYARDCYYKYNKNVDIYFHPQNISGLLSEEEALRLAKAINESNFFQVRTKPDGSLCIDKYDEYFDLSEDEYIQQILNKKNEVKITIIELLKTHRKNHYKNIHNVFNVIERQFNIKTLKRYTQPFKTLFYLCINELLQENKIKKYKDEENLYRALQRNELKMEAKNE